jgi:hypothetical protein
MERRLAHSFPRWKRRHIEIVTLRLPSCRNLYWSTIGAPDPRSLIARTRMALAYEMISCDCSGGNDLARYPRLISSTGFGRDGKRGGASERPCQLLALAR